MAELIPVDLIFHILQRSPVKTLLRFRCVCKSIRDIVDSLDFINSHLNTTYHERTQRKLILQSRYDSYNRDIYVVDIDGCCLKVFDTNDVQPELVNLFFNRYNFYAHCNGLILLGDDLYNLGVWNPSTRKFKKLPVCPGLCYDPDSPYHEYITGLGFGYDSSSDDYKVLLIKEFYVDTRDWRKSQSEIWILGFRSCYWKKIQALGSHEYILKRITRDKVNKNCFVDGAFHFVLIDGRVIAFDVAKETFSQVALPGEAESSTTSWFELQVFDGCLSITCSYPGNKFELYIRKKNGVEISWTKLFSFTCLPRLIMGLLGYSREADKILTFDAYAPSLYSYDVEEKSIQRIFELEDISSTTLRCDPHVIFYIESLVSVD